MEKRLKCYMELLKVHCTSLIQYLYFKTVTLNFVSDALVELLA